MMRTGSNTDLPNALHKRDAEPPGVEQRILELLREVTE